MKEPMTVEELTAYGEKISGFVTQLLAGDPSMSPITATVIAGDLISAEKATIAVTEGMDPRRAYSLVGSYARWDWVVTMFRLGHLSEAWFLANICDLWRGADPDDTDPDYLALWRRMKHRNGGLVRDGRPLPRSLDLQVYRGGPSNPSLVKGIAWTLDPKVARGFANGAGVRVQQKGIVVSGSVKRGDVIAYITGRNESEVIVDPRAIGGIHVLGGFA
jgi:hypothetical protein